MRERRMFFYENYKKSAWNLKDMFNFRDFSNNYAEGLSRGQDFYVKPCYNNLRLILGIKSDDHSSFL